MKAALLRYKSKIIALVSEDDYNETRQAEITTRLVDNFGSVEMEGFGFISFGNVDLKVKAVYIFTKAEIDEVEELDELTYIVDHFDILDDQD